MSLLSPESLSVFVSPTQLVAVHWRGLRPQIAGKRIVAVSPLPGAAWAGAARSWAELLPEFSACRRLRVILSGHFTPYQLLPWRDDLNDREEELTVARLAFTETYGEAAAKWQVRLSDEPPGIPRVAAAVDADLLAALEHSASANKARLVSIEPCFSAAVNHWRKRFNRGCSSWLVLHEEGRICLGLIEHGRWRWLRSLRVGAAWLECLAGLLDEEVILAGVGNAPTEALVFSPGMPDLPVNAATAWSFRRLSLDARPNFSPLTDSRFSLALVG